MLMGRREPQGHLAVHIFMTIRQLEKEMFRREAKGVESRGIKRMLGTCVWWRLEERDHAAQRQWWSRRRVEVLYCCTVLTDDSQLQNFQTVS